MLRCVTVSDKSPTLDILHIDRPDDTKQVSSLRFVCTSVQLPHPVYLSVLPTVKRIAIHCLAMAERLTCCVSCALFLITNHDIKVQRTACLASTWMWHVAIEMIVFVRCVWKTFRLYSLFLSDLLKWRLANSQNRLVITLLLIIFCRHRVSRWILL